LGVATSCRTTTDVYRRVASGGEGAHLLVDGHDAHHVGARHLEVERVALHARREVVARLGLDHHAARRETVLARHASAT